MFDILTLKNQHDLIDGVRLHKLIFNRDKRGFLVEILKSTWSDVFDKSLFDFGQSYCSMTLPGLARDEDQWHNHPNNQTDRFVVIKGSLVFALYDWREESKTKGQLNLFLMGEKNSDDNQYLLFIPKNVFHAFCNIGKEACYLLGNPNKVYDPKEEERILFSQTKAAFSDGTPFSWDKIRKKFKS